MVEQDAQERGSRVVPFHAPKSVFAGLDADETAHLLAAAADITLVLDGEGIVRDVAFGSESLSQEGFRKWVGQPWIETVTVESRPKIEALLGDTTTGSEQPWRQVNHSSSSGANIPIHYSVASIGTQGYRVAFGRDLRPVGALQQRLIEAQQSMDRDYWRLRNVETRYRLLFQMAAEPVLIVDATSFRVVEANPAALQVMGDATKRVVGRSFPFGLNPASTEKLSALMASLRIGGKGEDVHVVRADGTQREFTVSASLVRQESMPLFLISFHSANSPDALEPLPRAKSMLLKVVENATDGFVVTTPDGKILLANRAFADLAELATEEAARGEDLDRWLGRPGIDLQVLLANLKQHGAIRLYSTHLRGNHGATAEVEVSAVFVPSEDHPCVGFTVRNIGQRLGSGVAPESALPRSVEQLTQLVGRVSLKDLVRESTDLIERLCIEAALELTHDNRASAAEMLGLSRQSLYVKLRRHGLGDLSDEGES
ncbi:MAG: transcriptional regulator PpsR [Burkholderiaceae bacterium]|jgi:transcriptional regulator PpsR